MSPGSLVLVSLLEDLHSVTTHVNPEFGILFYFLLSMGMVNRANNLPKGGGGIKPDKSFNPSPLYPKSFVFSYTLRVTSLILSKCAGVGKGDQNYLCQYQSLSISHCSVKVESDLICILVLGQ